MTTVLSRNPSIKSEVGSPIAAKPIARRADALADRLEQGARALTTFARGLTEAEWQTRVPKDGRKIGVTVHHVATMYPLEIQLAQGLAKGQPVTGVTWDLVAEL